MRDIRCSTFDTENVVEINVSQDKNHGNVKRKIRQEHLGSITSVHVNSLLAQQSVNSDFGLFLKR